MEDQTKQPDAFDVNLQINQITRMIKRDEDMGSINKRALIERLQEVQDYVGKFNQPSVTDIFDNDQNI